MVIGATVFGYIVGSVSALASNPNGSQARETVKILAVSNYLGEKKVQMKLRQVRFFSLFSPLESLYFHTISKYFFLHKTSTGTYFGENTNIIPH